MKAILWLAVLLCFERAQAFSNEPPAAWFLCDHDEDCVDIQYPCVGGTVNKKFAKDANKLYNKKASTINCIESAPLNPKDEKTPPFKVFCDKGKCQKQGRNPKMGFS